MDLEKLIGSSLSLIMFYILPDGIRSFLMIVQNKVPIVVVVF